MKYLNLEDDKIYILKILEDKITPRTYHWRGNRSVNCQGKDCYDCYHGQAKRYEGWLDVELNGGRYRWSFPAAVGVKIKDVAPRLLDAVISVKKSPGPSGARWDITRVLVEPELEFPDAPIANLKPRLRLMADTLKSMMEDLNKEADKLPGAG